MQIKRHMCRYRAGRISKSAFEVGNLPIIEGFEIGFLNDVGGIYAAGQAKQVLPTFGAPISENLTVLKARMACMAFLRLPVRLKPDPA